MGSKAGKGITFHLSPVLSKSLEPAYFKKRNWDSYRTSLLISCFSLPILFPSFIYLCPFSIFLSFFHPSFFLLPSLPLFFLSILGIKPKASCTLGLYHRATSSSPCVFFCFDFFLKNEYVLCEIK